MKWNSEDTIAAIATPLGIGGVGIVRLSGDKAVSIVDPIFRPAAGDSLASAESHRMLYGWIATEDGPIDEVLVVAMRAPRSYTREDVVEIHCHGGPLVLQTVLELVCRAGARLAEPGEFTLRAFFNGRIDLTQVEAVADIVRARSQAGLRVTANQLRGRLYEAIQGLKEELSHVAALLAAGIDFPEEDVVFAHREEIAARLDKGRTQLRELLRTAERGRILREGLAVAIAGRPNVGKSSLLNALLRENRAIVTEVPGTTRDTVEEAAEVGGVVLRLTDTAGIRTTADRVEKEGIARSRRALDEADLVLLLLDGSEPLTGEDTALLDEADPEATLVIVNKRDLMAAPRPAWAERLAGFEYTALSALTREGLDDLEAHVRRRVFRGEVPVSEHGMITNLRQKQAAQQALEALEAAREGLEGNIGDELLAVDLQRALDALGAIVGETTADDLLNRIFAEFCIGK
jgi:tRNA modification GTPase